MTDIRSVEARTLSLFTTTSSYACLSLLSTYSSLLHRSLDAACKGESSGTYILHR
jgi:hypothetical protein